jgi:phosphoribosylformylglycinamidine synthase
VQGGSVVKPLTGKKNDGPSDAGIVRPVLAHFNGVVVSHGICPKYSRFDTYHMVACAIDEAIRNNIASGGSLKKMALLDNFCWSDPVASERNPEGQYKLAQLVRANRALYDYTTFFGTPCISGKDSMKNDYTFNDIKISVPQTVLISALSVINDVRKAVTMDVKESGDFVFIIGMTHPELGGSEYFSYFDRSGNIPPRVRAAKAKKTFLCLEKAIKTGIIRSCHDVSDGGIACSLAESSFAGDLGMEIDLTRIPRKGIYRDDFLLFSESQSRFVVTVKEENIAALEKIFKGVPYGVAGKVRNDERFIIRGINGNVVIDTETDFLKDAWQAPFKELFL